MRHASLEGWSRLQSAARATGLTVVAVVDREAAEAAQARSGGPVAGGNGQPQTFYPLYRKAVVLGSGGGAFWRRFREAHPQPPELAADPLARFTEAAVAPLLEIAREDDPQAVAAYPFDHERQLLPFAGLLAGVPALAAGPFGLAVHPEHGPWFAWRAAILTAADYPASEWPAASPCASCPAPCESACPVGAVDRAGFRWRDCIDYRVAAATCREGCLAREACPVGTASRYPDEAMRYHYRASLRQIGLRGLARPVAVKPT